MSNLNTEEKYCCLAPTNPKSQLPVDSSRPQLSSCPPSAMKSPSERPVMPAAHTLQPSDRAVLGPFSSGGPVCAILPPEHCKHKGTRSVNCHKGCSESLSKGMGFLLGTATYSFGQAQAGNLIRKARTSSKPFYFVLFQASRQTGFVQSTALCPA